MRHGEICMVCYVGASSIRNIFASISGTLVVWGQSSGR